jgi:hypothetical protein
MNAATHKTHDQTVAHRASRSHAPFVSGQDEHVVFAGNRLRQLAQGGEASIRGDVARNLKRPFNADDAAEADR